MVLGATSPTLTPPAVTMASLTGRVPVTSSAKCFSACTSPRRCSFVRLLAFSLPVRPARRSSTGIMLWGTSPAAILLISRLGFSPMSRSSRASSFCSSSAGFRSISSRYVSPSQRRRWALADSTSGPDTPKWVNSSSPNSRNTGFFFPLYTVSSTFRRLNPCMSGQSLPAHTSGTSEPRGGTTVCPSSCAMR